MTVRELIYNSSHELNCIIVSYAKLYDMEIEIKFNSHNISEVTIPHTEQLLNCDVRDWKIEDETTIRIWTGDDYVWKVINS